MTVKHRTLLIELDTILDTRLSTLYKMSPTATREALFNGYTTRIHNTFKGISTKEFLDNYNNRDKEVLKDAVITPMVNFLEEFSDIVMNDSILFSSGVVPKIILNTYPYTLTEDEISAFKDAIVHYSKGKADVLVVNYSYEEISPRYLKENIDTYVSYEYYKWLEIQTEIGGFKEHSCPDVNMLGPLFIFTEEISHDYDFTECVGDMIELSRMFINLDLIDADRFAASIGVESGLYNPETGEFTKSDS